MEDMQEGVCVCVCVRARVCMCVYYVCACRGDGMGSILEGQCVRVCACPLSLVTLSSLSLMAILS